MAGTVHEGIRGNTGIVSTFDGDAMDGDVKNMRITTEDKDDSDLTFAEAASGETKDFQLTVTALQSTAAGSFWRLVWDDPAGEFAVVYGPHGNALPTVDKPHFNMTVKATGKPEVGREASTGKQRADFEYVFDVIAGPTLDDGA